MRIRPLISIIILAASLAACVRVSRTSGGSTASTDPATGTFAAPADLTSSTPTATAQPTATTTTYGPDADSYPDGINPLSGLPADDPQLLKIPAVLVSISHFPPTGRPQSGLSFAPFVYEFSITRGETRFLAAFYGSFPEPEVPITGDCPVRVGTFTQTSTLLGNRVWLDSNSDGIQDPNEGGIPGICVQVRSPNGTVEQTTTTDSNGIFGFNLPAGGEHSLRFLTPKYLDLTAANRGLEEADSDADPQTGATALLPMDSASLNWDAGMTRNDQPLPEAVANAVMPPAAVGPVRSGRLLYGHLGNAYTDSCLIYAFADPTVLAKIPHCAFVSHEDEGGGEMISIERMRAVAEDNMRHTAERPFNYASNLYSETPPTGGIPGARLHVYFNRINQSAWVYDPLYNAYLRLVDMADPDAIGVLHPDVDRLTGRQLHFENVIIAMVDTEVITRTNLDIHLEGGNTGPARLFRDGRVFDITWSTRGGEYEKKTGVRRPIEFLGQDGTAVALKPGHTWVILVTPFSYYETHEDDSFSITYAPPAGEAQ